MDVTPLRAEMMTFINVALHKFQAQTAANTRNHVKDALDDLRQTLPTLVSAAESTEMLMQTANGTTNLAPDSPR